MGVRPLTSQLQSKAGSLLAQTETERKAKNESARPYFPYTCLGHMCESH